MFAYTVRVEFTGIDAAELSQDWLHWMTSEHLGDVLAAGAGSAELVQLDSQESPVLEARYHFQNRAGYEAYLSDHAPRLREAGLLRFPVAKGIRYERSAGEILASRSH